MTKQEKIIVSAYTGVLMCDFDDLHEYIQKKFGRPVFTHELADKGIQKEVEEKSKKEFLEICNREEPEQMKGKWIDEGEYAEGHSEHAYYCSQCEKHYIGWIGEFNFCPNCGAKMEKGETDGNQH